MVAVQALTLGYALDVQSPTSGVVHSVYPRAVNLEIRGALWTVLTQDRDELAFGLRVALDATDVLRLQRGERVHVRAGWVSIGDRQAVIDCRAAARWIPAAPAPAAPGLPARIEALAAAAAPHAWSGSARMARAVIAALQKGSGLDEVLRKVVGCGVGSTPSGDDVLAGILAVLTCTRAGRNGAAAARALAAAIVPRLPATAEISAQLLRQAADGHFGRAVHELIAALVCAPAPHALTHAVRRLLAAGATSGADTCLGMAAAARAYLAECERRMAA